MLYKLVVVNGRKMIILEILFANWFLNHLRQNSRPIKNYYIFPHRIDRVTEGLIIVVKQNRFCRILMKQFNNKSIQKIYHALIEHSLTKVENTLTDYHQKNIKLKKAILSAKPEGFVRAELRYKEVKH